MDKFYPPYFPCYIPLPNGKPAAGGKLYAYFTGTDNLAPLYAEDGTILVGSVADIDSSGQVHVLLDPAITYRLKVVPPVGSQMPDQIYDNVRVANGTIVGMENPMTDQGDMIVGAAAGVPMRLAHPNGIGFLRATLSFGMKVLQWVGLTGTKGIEVTNGTSGTEIGLDTTGASEGDALKIVSGVPTWTTDQTGMQNPMTTKGDLIVGNTDGAPDRLGVGNDGDILGSWLFAGNVQPKWEAGPKKYRNVYHNIPSPDIDDGYLGCLFYMTGGGAQTIDLPSSVSIPNKSFIDFVFLDDTTTLTITPQGGSVLNTQATAVTVGGKSATLYRLTFLGRGDIGGVPTDQWAVGGSVLPDGKVIAATGDATRGTLNAKINPESPLTKEVETDIHGVKTLKLALELGNDEEVLTTEEDGLGNKSANWKLPSGKLKVTSADTALDYLANKLVQGTGIIITTQTDPDTGVQTLEFSATGGGGGGRSGIVYWEPAPVICSANLTSGSKAYAASVPGALLPEKIKSFSVIPTANPYSVANFNLWVAIYDADETDRPLISSFSWDASKHPSTNWSYRLGSFNFDATISIDSEKMYRCVMFFNGVSSWGVPAQAQGSYFLWGNVNYSGGANTQPLPKYTQYTGWAGVAIVPWFRLNSWSV